MILLLITLFVFALFKIYQTSLARSYPNGPTPLPLIGNVHQLIYTCWKSGRIVDAYRVFEKQYGKVFTIWIGPIPTVYINDYDIAYETHVKRAAEFGTRHEAGIMNYLRDGTGITSSNGELWQQHRRFALQTLKSFGLGKNLMETRIMDELNLRCDEVEKNVNNNDKQSIVVNANEFFDILIGSLINQLLLSGRFEPNDANYKRMKANLEYSLSSFSVFDMIVPDWVLTSKFLKWRQAPILKPLEDLNEYVRIKVQERMDSIESGDYILDENPNDFLDAYLYKMRCEEENADSNSTFTFENMVSDIFDLWSAGQEPTSLTLKWGFLLFLHNPEVEEKVRKELMKVTSNGARPLSLADKQETPYLNATINEINRIASVLNVNFYRILTKDTKIDNIPLKSGTILTTQISVIHTDENNFEEPDSFYPERYFNDKNLEKKLIPFGIGKRACPGEGLGRAELYLIIGNLLLRYKLEACGKLPPVREINPFGVIRTPPHFDMKLVKI